jgi:hypothetical protein
MKNWVRKPTTQLLIKVLIVLIVLNPSENTVKNFQGVPQILLTHTIYKLLERVL